MSLSMLKMWISIVGIGLMAVSMLAIHMSRYKIKVNFLKIITAFIAYFCLVMGALIMIFVILSGPSA